MNDQIKKILVINAGSSSLKWALYADKDLELLGTGICERIALDGNLILKDKANKYEHKENLPNHLVAVEKLLKYWKEHNFISELDEIEAIGFRIPYAGFKFLSPVFYSPEVRESIVTYAEKFIPLHTPPFLATLDGFIEYLPNVPKIVAQDTAFHTDIPKINRQFSINKEWATKYNIEKFGYHGLSHDYITGRMKQILGKDKINIVVAHLGSGSSLCAIKDGKSFDISVGFSSTDGLMMGTRSGAIDPGIVDYLVRIEHKDPQEVFDMLVKNSGLLGVSGISSDIRDLHKLSNENEDAKFAIELYAQRVVDYMAMYLNKIHYPDAIVFTAGMGENDAVLRKMIIDKVKSYKLFLDQESNLANYEDYMLISSQESEIPIYKMRTNEEIVIAKYVKELVNSHN